ncbi:MAG: hypothetical protein AAGJ68_12375, partial [Pseudomonadota bacterium]
DYIVVVELGVFLGAGMLALEIARRLSRRWQAFELFPKDMMDATAALVMAGIAAHFANYFFSGYAKLQLDGGPWLWVTQNPTEVLISNSWVGGFLPTAHLENVASATYAFGEATRPLVNVATLLGQLAALVMLARRSLMIAITLFYDLTHVVIYLLTGIFFWKWIILNLALVAAMRQLPDLVERKRVVIAAMLLVFLSQEQFSVARLGWYDTPAQTVSEVYAVTTDGREVRVPSNFFGTVSVTSAQHRFGRIEDGHYPTSTWGTAYSEEEFLAGIASCSFEGDTTDRFRQDRSKIERLVQIAHAYSVERHAKTGDYKYDLFPHHIWSNPWYFDEFAALVPGDIEHYIYRTRSECVSMENGAPQVRLDYIDEFRIEPTEVANLTPAGS